MDSRIEVEATPQEPAPSHDAFRPLGTVSKVDVPQAATKPPPSGFLTKAQRKSPPLLVGYSAGEAPQSATESFDLGGGDLHPLGEPEELESLDGRQLETAAATVQSYVLSNTEGATKATATTAPVKVSALPAPKMGVCFPPALPTASLRLTLTGKWRLMKRP